MRILGGTSVDSPIEIYPFKIDDKRVRENRSLPDDELLYVSRSPNFCEKDLKRGILGTSGRKCNTNSTGPDGCKEMCCGRGYYIENHIVSTVFGYHL